MDVQQSYAQWLKDFASDPETVAELESIRGNDAEIEDRFYTELSFGTAGMRGVLGAGTNRMNRYNVRRATKGLAAYLHTQPGAAERGVVIAYDSRRCSDLFARETAQVLCQEGVKAYLFDALRPVPILSYAVRHLGAAAGVVITASHNPPQYNGYKVYGEDGAQLGPEAAAGVTSFIRATPYTACVLMDMEEAKAKGLLHIIGNKEVDDDYIAQVKTLCVNPEMLAREGSSLSIVYTPLHGSGNVPVRRILKEVGITHVSVVKEQELPDPNFSTLKVPNPEDPSAFTLAMKLADEVGADVIFGTDPDCDRLGVAVRDKEGKFQLLTGNQIGCVLLHYILSSRKAQGTLPANGAAVKSIVSTSLANRICEDYGVEMFETLTGFKFIGEKIQQFQDTGSHTFLFGFEESYGFLSSTFVRDKDGVNASLLIAELAASCKAQGITLYDRLQEIFARYGTFVEKVVSTTLPGKDGVARMQQIMKDLRAEAPKEIGGLKVTAVRDYLRGVRVENGVETPTGLPTSDVLYFELEGGNWVCVRPSGTEPKIKLYVNTNHKRPETAHALNETLCAASQALMQ
ncbi:MAG TPA: phospho-sugar mutase [Candidatus Egerieenecus merdigallinarum]|nr:phospho-sugar mutase [Candidatus Egerieenecus merdigallinarum]